MSLANYNIAGYYDDVLTVYCADASGTSVEGQALCWDVAATLNSNLKTAMGGQVKQPATANLMAFAGVVVASCAGRAYPCFLDVIPWQKNRFAKARVKLSTTAFSTILGIINAQYELGTWADSGINTGLVGIAAETFDSSGVVANSSDPNALRTILFK